MSDLTIHERKFGDKVIYEMLISGEVIGRCDDMTMDKALDAFAANWPEHAAALDDLKSVEWLCGPSQTSHARDRAARQPTAGRKPGSGQRFRELILAGASNAEALAAVRAEFPESRATLSDAAWNRRELKVNPKYKGLACARPQRDEDDLAG